MNLRDRGPVTKAQMVNASLFTKWLLDQNSATKFVASDNILQLWTWVLGG